MLGNMMKKAVLRSALLGISCTLLVAPAGAKDIESARIIVGYAPGATIDIMTRLIAEKMRVTLNRTITVENRTGAGGVIANEAVKLSPADGTVLLVAPITTMVVYPHSYTNLKYNPFTDFVPVATISRFHYVFGTSTQVPAKTVAEYTALLKQDPKKYALFSSAGAGSPSHFFGMLLGQSAGVKMTHVAYRGSAPILQAIMANEIPAAFLTLSDLGNLARSGKANLLAVAGASRSPSFPNVPTLKELGIDVEGYGTYGLFAPAKTPPDVVKAYEAALLAAVNSPDIKQRFEQMVLEPAGAPGDQLAAQMKTEYAYWEKIIKASGFKQDK
jgi:tripartite-type tricarboxylate transporter receptor subunit TctC